MKNRTTNFVIPRVVAIALALTIFAAPVFAQRGNAAIKTNSKILYHNGPVMTQTVNLYFIYYGNWNAGPGNDAQTRELIFW